MMKKTLIATLAALPLMTVADAQVPLLGDNIPVINSESWSVDPVKKWGVSAIEYIHMEHQFFANLFQSQVGINTFFHFQDFTTKDMVWVVSPNQDTLYSMAVVDARHDFTVTLPDVSDRFISLQVQDFNHVFVAYENGGGEYHFKSEDIDTDYVLVGVRTGTDATVEDAAYIAADLQPKMKIETDGQPDLHIVPVNSELMLTMRGEFIEQFQKLDTPFGWVEYSQDDVPNWENKVYVVANSFGLSHHTAAMYTNGFPEAKGGDCYYGKFAPVPYSDFSSVTVYGHDRYLMTNYREAPNAIGTEHKEFIALEDGSFEIMFGAEECRVNGMNYINTPEDNWHFMVRAYGPDVDAMEVYQVPELKKVAANK
ncbi:DUF1214 domain-containing protein [Vibrio kyushuensis]|uniref:DUF1214 domain-containing protein n=1 Tax=Vibrio kyushuensis TaxID=2910249 RepID=UPI003D0F6E2C